MSFMFWEYMYKHMYLDVMDYNVNAYIQIIVNLNYLYQYSRPWGFANTIATFCRNKAEWDLFMTTYQFYNLQVILW